MSGLIGGSGKGTSLAGFRVQTSIAGKPIAIVYGTARLAGNLIHMPAQPHKVGSSHSGFFGPLFHSKGAQTDDYAAPIAIALCEGPIAGIGNVWQNKDAPKAFTGNFDAAGWTKFLGTASQAAWSYLTGNFAAQAVPYQFTAYVANQAASLPNDSLPELSWEIQGFLRFNAGGGIVDASPADIVPDFLTAAQFGVGVDPAFLGDLSAFQDYCAAAGLFCSPVFDAASPARDLLSEILEVANTGAVWSDGRLTFVPYGDTNLSGNGHTFTANVTPAYDLTDDDFLPSSLGDDPIVVTRRDPASCYNQVTVEYEDRDNGNDYNTQTYQASDQLSVLANGPRPLPTLSLHSIKSAAVAQLVAQIRLQRELYIRNTYQFNLGWRFSRLEPMDLVTLTDAGLGLNRTPVRIIEIQELDGEKGFAITAEEWPLGVAHAAQYTTGVNTGTGLDAGVAPGATLTPLIFEGPFDLSQSALELWIAASGGDHWGGCDVWVSTDNATFTKVGRIASQATFGELTAALPAGPAGPAIDSTHTVAIDVSGSGGTLLSVPASDRDGLLSLCYVGGEFLAYEVATLTGSGQYSLTSLVRGAYGSTIATSRAIGTPFARCDLAVLRLPFPQGSVGQVVYFKFPAFNVFGAALEDLSAVASVSHTIGTAPITGAGAPQVNISVDAETDTTASVSLDGSLGAGAAGPLQWRYRASDGSGPGTFSSWSTAALPQTVSITRLAKDSTAIEAEVVQADGQTGSAIFPLRPSLPALAPTTGRVQRAVPDDDGDYAVASTTNDGRTVHGSVVDTRGALVNALYAKSIDTADDISTGVAKRVPTLVEADGGGYAAVGLQTNGDVARDVPLPRAVANVPAISGSTGKLKPSVALDGTTGTPVHTQLNVAALADGPTVTSGAARGAGGFTNTTGALVSTAVDTRGSLINDHYRLSGDTGDDIVDGVAKRVPTLTEADGGGYAALGLATNGDVARDVPLGRAIGNIPSLATDGKLDPSVALHGTTGTPVHTQHAVAILTDGATVTAGAGRANAGLDSSGDVQRDVPLLRAAANIPAINTSSGLVDPTQPMHGIPFAPAHHIDQKIVVSGAGSVAFSVGFQNPPKMVGMPQVIAGPASTGLAFDIRATSVTATTFVPRAVYSTGGSATPESELFAATLGGTTNPSGIAITTDGGVAYSSLAHANATLTTYQVTLDIDMTAAADPTRVNVNIYKYDGATYTLVQNATYFGGQVLSGDVLSFSDTLGSGYSIRVVTTYAFAPGSSATGTITAREVDYDQIGAPTDTPMATSGSQGVLFQAMENV